MSKIKLNTRKRLREHRLRTLRSNRDGVHRQRALEAKMNDGLVETMMKGIKSDGH